MDYTSIFAISAAGMTLERTRVEVAAQNMANANTVAAPGQAGFKPLHVVATSAPTFSFASLMVAGEPGTAVLEPSFRLMQRGTTPRLVHEPGHPLADERGFVSYPGVDTATEMISLLSASRAYEANVAAMNIARTLALKALEIGSGS